MGKTTIISMVLIACTLSAGAAVSESFVNGPPIPAPGALLLGSIGVGVVGWLRRRRTL